MVAAQPYLSLSGGEASKSWLFLVATQVFALNKPFDAWNPDRLFSGDDDFEAENDHRCLFETVYRSWLLNNYRSFFVYDAQMLHKLLVNQHILPIPFSNYRNARLTKCYKTLQFGWNLMNYTYTKRRQLKNDVLVAQDWVCVVLYRMANPRLMPRLPYFDHWFAKDHWNSAITLNWTSSRCMIKVLFTASISGCCERILLFSKSGWLPIHRLYKISCLWSRQLRKITLRQVDSKFLSRTKNHIIFERYHALIAALDTRLCSRPPFAVHRFK